jgi:hypothetical protein
MNLESDGCDQRNPADDGKSIGGATERRMSETLEPFFIMPESLVSSDRQDHEPNRNEDNGFDKRPQAPATPLGQELSSHIIECIYGLPGFSASMHGLARYWHAAGPPTHKAAIRNSNSFLSLGKSFNRLPENS